MSALSNELRVFTGLLCVLQVTQIINLSAGGGWVTTSNLSTVVPPETRRDLEIACYAANAAVRVTEVGRHTVTVLCESMPADPERYLQSITGVVHSGYRM